MRRASEQIGGRERRRFGGVLHEPRVLLGIAVMCAATAVGAFAMERASARVQVWQFDRPLAADTVLTGADVHVAAVAGDGFASAYAPAATPVVGRRITRAVRADEYVAAALLAVDRKDARDVTVAVAPLHAPIAVRHGQRVDVWVTTDPESARALGRAPKTRLVLADVLVGDVLTADVSGALGVVLRVGPAQEEALVSAVRAGEIDLVGIGGHP